VGCYHTGVTTPVAQYWHVQKYQPVLEYKCLALILAILKAGKGLQIGWLQGVKQMAEPLLMKTTMSALSMS